MENLSHSDSQEFESQTFEMTILGRLLEHLGVQMYKRRDVAIAELVANCWDAGAEEVKVFVPNDEEYDPKDSKIKILDNGRGMSPDDIENKYLVVGRNRRKDENTEVVDGRKVMGRKGIGKLAGFGIASKINVITWKDGVASEITMDIENLKTEDNTSEEAEIDGAVGPVPEELGNFSDSGTQVILHDLKHKTSIDEETLLSALGRRYSRSIRGRMQIYVNGKEVDGPSYNFNFRVPEEGFKTEVLESGEKVKYFYGFTDDPIQWKELRGLTVMARGKTAQAPPFFFDVEGSASGQHGTKYLAGEVHADFLDEGKEDEDLIATDRQEIDWENEEVAELYQFGDDLTREALRERRDRRAEEMEEKILEVSDFEERINRLEKSSQDRVKSFLRKLGKTETDPESAETLADSLVRAFEYRHFHDVVGDIEEVSDDPEELELLLEKLRDWKVLESRAILEVVNGRLQIVDKFGSMILNDAPETAGKVGDDNMHDLLASYPWLLNPDWQVLSEETSLSKQLEKWDSEEVGNDQRRYDFLALRSESLLVVVEIKRQGHPVSLAEVQRMNSYRNKLARAREEELHMMLVSGGRYEFDTREEERWDNRPDCELVTWSQLHRRAERHYEHYRALLQKEIDDPDFDKKKKEIARTRDVLEEGVYRGEEGRSKGLGQQDVELVESK